MNAVYILCVKNHINCTEERSRKDGEFTTAPEQRLPGTMPQEGRCPCLFQAARKFDQLYIVNPRVQAARIVFSRVSAQSEVQSPSVSLSAFATSDVSQSKGIKKVRSSVIADLVENLWQFILRS